MGRPGRTAREGIVGLHHLQIAIPTGRASEARTFYSDSLGLPEIPKPTHLAVRGGLWFRAGDRELHLGIDPEFHPVWKNHPAFLVRGIARYRTRLAARGVPVFDDLPLPGHRRFYAQDPFGNRLEFVEPDVVGRSARRGTRTR